MKNNKFFTVTAYAIAIAVLIFFLVEQADVMKLYWTRLTILALMGICAILSIGGYINTSFIKRIKVPLLETIEVVLAFIYLLLLIINLI